MRFLSLFSGIEAASAAWLPLGWECAAVAEVEPFPCSLLKHHYPEVPNLGDVTKITADQIKALGHIDLVCGGFPCQDLSVAGKRKGLNNADGTSTRSGLFFDAMRIADWANPRWLFIENVPGMFSSNSGRDFAAVVGEMAGCEFAVPRDGWRNAGVVVGPRGLVEWSVMDAQYHGLAQRRKRVFLVRDSGDWANRPPIFLEPYRLQGHPAPRREKGKVAPTTPSRSTAGGGLGTDFDCDGGLIPSPRGVTIHGTDKTARVMSYTDIAGSLRTKPPGSIENSSSTAVLQPFPHAAISPALKARDHKGVSSDGDGDGAILVPMLAHALRGEGFDASEDGTGRGTPLVPVAAAFKGGQGSSAGGIGYDEHISPTLSSADSGSNRTPVVMTNILAFDTTQVTSQANRSNQQAGDPCHPLAAGMHAPAIAFQGDIDARTYEADALHRLRSGAQGARLLRKTLSAIQEVGRPAGNKSQSAHATMQVRRLTVVECSRLQGFPDDYLTQVTWRKQCPPADGPMYKALGNSWAVPNVRWIGEHIQAVALINSAEAATNLIAELELA